MKPYITIITLSLILSACGGKTKQEETASEAPPVLITKEEVGKIYDLYVNGNYDAYVDEMLSCDNKPAAYRQQMATLFKQHAADQAKSDGKITAVEVTRIQSCNKGKAAEAYLNITYSERKTEEIMLQLVHDGWRWRLR